MKTSSVITILLLCAAPALHAQDVFKATSGTIITVQNGASLYISGGGLALDNGSTVSNAGTITIARTGGNTADLTDNTVTPYNYGTGKFVFNGSGTQTVNSPNQFERIDVDNTGLTLAGNTRANTWFLKSGKVTTGAFMAIASAAAAGAVQADAANTNFANSWINGKLRRFITPALVNNYQFPVGDASRVNMAEMDNLTAAPLTGTSYVDISFGPKPGNDVGLNVTENGTAYSSISTGGVWYIVPDAVPASGKYDLKLYFNGFTGLSDNKFAMLRRPDASSNAAEWIVPVGSTLPVVGNPGRLVADGYARRNNISSFSQWGIGITLSPLPLQLLNFYAVKKDKSVLLQWTTANEINTSHFEIFKGPQPSAMSYLDKVTATGTSGNHSYDYTDYKPLKGLSFYQLKMFDKDNSFKLSETVKVNFEDINMLSVYPNPVVDRNLFVEYNGGKVKEIKLIAADGKQLVCSFVAQLGGQLKVAVPAIIAKGAYTLQLVTDDGLRNTTILVQ
ncbi:T9SS type A sorting domain-containing protein [Ferruginibacter sp.]